jgi:hypothetical protein
VWPGSALTGSLPFSVALALHDDLVGVVGEPVDGALGKHGVLEQRDPFVDGAIASQDGGSSAVPLQDDFVEVAGLLGVEAAKGEIVNDQQIGGEQASEDLVGGLIGPGLVELMEEAIGAHEQHLAPGAAGGVAEGTGEEGFSNAHRAEQDHVFLALDKSEREEISDPIAIEANRSIPVEALQGLFLIEAGSTEAQGEVFVIAPLAFVLQEEFEQVELGELGLSGIGHPIGKRCKQAGEL